MRSCPTSIPYALFSNLDEQLQENKEEFTNMREERVILAFNNLGSTLKILQG